MEISVRDCGNGRFEVMARGARLIVDQPVADGGDPGGFRPTELLLAALATCTASTMRNFAAGNGITEFEGVDIDAVADEMDRPRRVGHVTLELRVRGDLSEQDVDRLVRVGKHCKVHNTLHRDPQVTVAVAVPETGSTA